MIFARFCIEADSIKCSCGHLPQCKIGDDHPTTIFIEPQRHSFEAAWSVLDAAGLLLLTMVRLGDLDAFADHA